VSSTRPQDASDVLIRSRSVLIVDDERVNRDLLSVMLAPEGHQLFMAANGEEALALVAQQPLDLILLDIMMPGIDGYQVLARIRHRHGSDVPIIMLSALNDRNSRLHGMTAGASDYLTKPVDRAELLSKVRKFLPEPK
jgi:CheY-like chemotaxis protein